MPKFIDRLLGLDKLKQAQQKNYEMLSGGFSGFSQFTGSAYSNDIFRSAVDSIARHIAKLNGKHVVDNTNEPNRYSKLNRLLQDRPNVYMSSYDFLYKVATQYFIFNNAFIYIQKDNKGNLTGLYPLTPSSVEYVVDGNEEMYIKFLFKDGKILYLHISEVAVLRRHFNSNELLGDNNDAIMSSIELAQTQNEAMREAIKNSAQIRGIIKYNEMMGDTNLKETKDRFMNDYLSMSNNGGVIAVDTKADYIPLNPTNVQIDTPQMETVKKKIYDYLGINENIVSGSYDEIGWQAFFESTIEPFAIQTSSELTEKIFTEREKSFANRIVFEASKLQYASNQSKTNVIKELLPLGVLTVNQALDLMNLPRVEDGDKRIQSLNYIDKEIANTYQLQDKEAQADERN